MNLSTLEGKLGVKLAKVRKDNKQLSLKAQIMRQVNTKVHEMLCKEFGEYYKEIESDIIITNKEGDQTLQSVRGYRLLIPKSDIQVGSETHEGFSVGNPTTYLDGINTNDCLYFKEIGNTKVNK